MRFLAPATLRRATDNDPSAAFGAPPIAVVMTPVEPYRVSLSLRQYPTFESAVEHVQTKPVRIHTSQDLKQHQYLIRNAVWLVSEDEVRVGNALAVLPEKEFRRESRTSGLLGTGAQGRKAISSNVKMFVWQRDGGRCVQCGSQQRLEYDHIIPVSLGGSNTARNLQVLCEPCNRSKGATLG